MKPEVQAYWISPSGKAIEVPQLHILTVTENPKKFGYTKVKLMKVFDKYKEPYGHEGYARQDIMEELLKKGWIRTRYNVRQDTWSIESGKPSSKFKDHVFDWVAKMVQKKQMGKFAGIQIATLDGKMMLNGDAEDVIKFTIFEDANFDRPEGNFLVEFCKIEDFKYTVEDVLG